MRNIWLSMSLGNNMNPFISTYLKAEERLQLAHETARNALTLAKDCAQPTKGLRFAKPDDIKVGAVLWYERNGWDETWEELRYFWEIVQDVHNPHNPYKAYTSHTGCRYGLDGAMVEFE